MKQKILLVLALIAVAVWLAVWLPLVILPVGMGLLAVVILCGGLQLLGDVMR